ncbi:MAG TPA: NUDIX domain-containing protein [Nocardioides sp.]|nr:NUDIX domain-containing protein [Nocardioides sp.]
MTAHSEALGALRTWPAPSREQAAVRDRLVTHLVEHPDGLERSCSPGHLTAGALVLSADLAEVLLNLHGRAGRWFHFGGHWERGDDSLLTTASREASEESGIAGLVVDPTPVHLDVHEVEFCRGHGRVDHLDVRYAALAPAGAQPEASDESLDVRWWPLGALPDLEPEMHELIARSRERLASRATAQSREAGSSRAAVE